MDRAQPSEGWNSGSTTDGTTRFIVYAEIGEHNHRKSCVEKVWTLGEIAHHTWLRTTNCGLESRGVYQIRVSSSFGRAPALQAGGGGFKSLLIHQFGVSRRSVHCCVSQRLGRSPNLPSSGKRQKLRAGKLTGDCRHGMAEVGVRFPLGPPNLLLGIMRLVRYHSGGSYDMVPCCCN
jgi:hypothetical protein